MAGNIVNWTCCRDMGVNMEVLFNLTNYVKLNIAPHLGQGCAHLAEGWGCRPWVPAAGAQVGPSGGGSAAGCTWLSWSFSGSSRNVLGWWAWLLLIFGGCMLVAQELCHCRSLLENRLSLWLLEVKKGVSKCLAEYPILFCCFCFRASGAPDGFCKGWSLTRLRVCSWHLPGFS